jgi:hypothetical protein
LDLGAVRRLIILAARFQPRTVTPPDPGGVIC